MVSFRLFLGCIHVILHVIVEHYAEVIGNVNASGPPLYVTILVKVNALCHCLNNFDHVCLYFLPSKTCPKESMARRCNRVNRGGLCHVAYD